MSVSSQPPYQGPEMDRPYLKPSQLLVFCTSCHYLGIPKLKRRGNFFVNWILMIFLVLPGIVYLLWRLCSSRLQFCPQCGSQNVIPARSLAAKKVVERLTDEEIDRLNAAVKKEEARLQGELTAMLLIIFVPICLVVILLFVIVGGSH
ncbi:MAG TPA: hypothetical protein V6C52_02960 [Coleofasciculaceae cyanobacterium]